MRWALSIVVLVACSHREPAEDRPAPPPRPVIERDPRPLPPSGRLQARWREVMVTEGCFYFSGPDGRDNKLVGEVVVDRAEAEAGGELTVTIAGARFTGKMQDKELQLVRQSTHEFGGPWKVTEDIRGRVIEGTFRGEYRYEECEVANRENCPGRCRITADLAFEK